MLRGLIYSQFLPGGSWLHRVDPRCKLLLLASGTLGLFLLRQAFAQLLLALLLLGVPVSAGIPRRLCWPALAGVLPLAGLTLFFQALWGDGPSWGWLRLNGMEQGGLTALRLLELTLLAHLLALTTSPIALCDALERMLHPFRRLGLPSRDLALAFTIAWRFIPVLALESQRLLMAQISRGACWEEGPWSRRLTTLLGLLTPLLVRCFRYAEDLATALEARGYTSSGGLATRLHPLYWRWQDGLVLLLWLLLLGGLSWWERAY